ncbi:MAG: hypothetical protein IKK78_01305, partial [Oscillospiraceae bacterium]|nr:hypothetical protein [Oscillospiraceae bacterium]
MQSLMLVFYDSTKPEKIKCFNRFPMTINHRLIPERTEGYMKFIQLAALLIVLMILPAATLAADMDAAVMENWLAQFAQALPAVPLLGDPQLTQDPSRPGEYLLEYAFGTVT